jgi:cell division protein FtsW
MQPKLLKKNTVDTFFIGIVVSLVLIGIVFFLSASLGIFARNPKLFHNIVINQLGLGIGCGIILFIMGFKIPYTFWKKHAFAVFVCALALMIVVFIPGLSFEHNGARRWIALGPISFQPAELLKIAFIIYFSAWLAWMKKEVHSFKQVILPFLIILGIMATLLFLQPDTKSFILMSIAGVSMLFISGAPIKHFIIVLILGILGILVLAQTTPYIQKRITTFIHPSTDVQGASYQLRQAFIAFGSGGVFGSGIGQSVQKFGYLPESQGDSIFAVIGEETGFIGTTICILLYLAFILRGMRISYHAPDQFSRLLVTGFIALFSFQVFLNIASLVGLFPLTGVPLVFMSHGGTSLAITLFAVGIITQISQYQKIV